MEKLLIPKTTPDMEQLFGKIFAEAFGNPIEFSSAPALSDLQPNSWGFSGNDIYIKTSTGAGIKLSGAAFT
jgi:hypothetical protein